MMINNFEKLLSRAQDYANEEYDGHITIMKFTKGWRCAYGTPDLWDGDGGAEVASLGSHKTLQEACV